MSRIEVVVPPTLTPTQATLVDYLKQGSTYEDARVIFYQCDKKMNNIFTKNGETVDNYVIRRR